MSAISIYIVETDSSEDDYGTDYQAARKAAEARHGTVACYEYEFSDSQIVDDFRDTAEEAEPIFYRATVTLEFVSDVPNSDEFTEELDAALSTIDFSARFEGETHCIVANVDTVTQ